MVVNFERAWSFQLFRRKLRNFSALQQQDELVCLVPADPVQQEVFRFKQMFDLEQKGFNPDHMEEEEQFADRCQQTKRILGVDI